MIGSIAKYAALALAAILLLLVLAALWLTHTASGSQWLWNRGVPLIPGGIEAGATGGAISDGFALTDVRYRSEGLDVDLAHARIAARVVLFPLSVAVGELHAQGVSIRQKKTPPPEGEGLSLQSLKLPFALRVADVQVRDLEVLNSAGEEVFRLNRATLAGQWHNEIDLSQLAVESSMGSLGGEVRLALSPPHTADADLAIVYPLQVGNDPAYPLRVHATAEGSLENLRVDLQSEAPDVRVTGHLQRLAGVPGWHLRVQSPYAQWPLQTGPGEPPQVYLEEVDLETSGNFSGYSIAGDGRVSVAGSGAHEFVLATSGDREGIEVGNLDLAGQMLAARASGALRWNEDFAVAADADVARFDPSLLTDAWPERQPVSGTVDASWSAGNVRLNEVRLRVQDAPTTLDAAGLVDVDGGIVDLELDWRDLRWPMEQQLAADATRFISEFGQVQVSGSPDDWTFDGRAAFRTDSLPQGVFTLSGRGDRDSVEAVLHDSEVLGGSVSGRGSYDWSGTGEWRAELLTRDVNLDPFAPDLSARISSDFTASGKLEPLELELDIRELDGEIRGRPVEGSGGIRYAGEEFTARTLRVVSGASELEADGSLRSNAGLDFRIDVAALEAFHPRVAGTLRGSGNISLAAAAEFPRLQLDLDAQELHWDDYALQNLEVTTIGASAGMPLSLEAKGTTLTVGTRQVDQATLQLAAGTERQRLQVTMDAKGQRIDLGLDGRLQDWRKPLQSTWTGQLQQLQFVSEGVSLSLVEPAALQLATDAISLEQVCVTGPEIARVCIAAEWTAGADYSLSADLNSVPVDLVRLWYDTDLEFSQTLTGAVALSGGAEQALSGEGDITISGGRVRNPIEPQVEAQTGTGELHFNLEEGQLLAGRLTLPFLDAAEIDARFEATDLSRGEASPVDGQLFVDLDDLSIVATFLPAIDRTQGQLNVDLAISGTLGQPTFAGDASLQNGSLRYAPLGLVLNDIEMQSSIGEDNRVDFVTRFRAGDGTGEIVSRATEVDSLDGGLELSLRGENLTVIDLPDISVVANPNIVMGIGGDGLAINGNVLVPRARITPVNLTAGDQVSESEDVVIVANGSSEEETEADEDDSPFRIEGTVAVALGNDVRVDLDVAEARISGNAAFHWDGPPMPVANGTYNVEGRFEAYGQLLDITEGLIQFPGVPASQPSLRIRAEREIFGNPQIRSAGVLVTGTPQNPDIDVYTNPETSRDRALTLLVTGSDFNYEQGVGAVDVGTYVAPDLFISYGIGLFERGNVISIRYDIAKGFGIKATSGKNAEGVDLSYTLER